MRQIKIETIVYRKLGYNREKELMLNEGPFRKGTIQEHNIVTIGSMMEPKKRRTVTSNS